jgi:GNAT superfamily N-acetyltransferase
VNPEPQAASVPVGDEAGTARGRPGGDHTASGVVVRQATAEDAAALVELRALMFEAMGTATEQLEHDAWREAALAWFTRRIGSAGVHVVVAQVDGQVAAAVVGEVTELIPGPGTPNGSVGLISNVATFPRYRGRGLAGLVTDDLLRWFTSSTDVTRVDLFATPGGARIYAPRGFTNRAFPGMSLPVPRAPADVV